MLAAVAATTDVMSHVSSREKLHLNICGCGGGLHTYAASVIVETLLSLFCVHARLTPDRSVYKR